MTRDIQERYGPENNIVVVSPDVGGVVRARALAKRIQAPIAVCDKRRERPGESEVMNVIGEVEGKRCILIDDIVDLAVRCATRRKRCCATARSRSAPTSRTGCSRAAR